MRRSVVMVLAGFVLAGCGSSGPSDEEQIRATLAALGQATAAKDYQRLCDEVFADELLDGIERIGLPCELALRQAFKDVEDPRLTVGNVRVDGDRASADVRSSAKRQQPSRDVLELVKGDEGWRVSSLGKGSPGPAPAPAP